MTPAVRRLLAGALAVAALLAAGVAWRYRIEVGAGLAAMADLALDRGRVAALVENAGFLAPLAFIGLQVLQVMLAPIPGEASGFIGGYLFGWLAGFFLSSIGLALGSWVNFAIGRLLGRRFVRRLIPPRHLRRLDGVARRQGALMVLALFVFPGFPKDYLCLFLGVSALPVRPFLVMATFGRMPGTLMLSLQGALLYERLYLPLALMTGACLVGLAGLYWRREAFYRWVERFSGDAGAL